MSNIPTNLDDSVTEHFVEAAKNVLKENLLGNFTKPAPGLYPHQWNWDAGFIALGYARSDFRQACNELSALFRGQWANGMVPQIVFSVQNKGKYFPGYVFWNTKGVPGKPRNVRTSGITMPPVHGFILNHLLKLAPDSKRYRPFFQRMFDRVLLLHQYCYEFRDPEREGLAFICHPWESGMDNLPTWEEVFTQIQFDASQVPPYERRDLEYVDAPYRPRKQSYDRYIYLVDLLRKQRYQEPEIWNDYPFQVQEPMFNAILNHSNEALLELGQWLGQDTGQLREWYTQTNQALSHKLWDESLGVFVSYDRVHRRPIPITTAGGLIPLLCGAANAEQSARMVSLIQSPTFSGTSENPAWLCASTALDEPGFDACRYWRGPVWINMNWLLFHGLRRYGQADLAARLRSDSLELVRKFGFWEYYNPWKNLPEGEKNGGYGADQFSWTAALVLDWLEE
ncbi:MAG: trehalase family glycosidase [Saprospiraceae bacterium]|nr:trehalase family glycosidase [Saprospiraceae bacterium]